MKIAIFSFTKKGSALADLISVEFAKAGYECEKYQKLSFVESAFSLCGLLVFISATGIAVRGIAPFVKDKAADPAVVSLDDNGKFIISLLSGHMGGGNDFAKQIASFLCGTAVISTATDVNGKFACDEWGKKNGCEISDMKIAKAVSAEILNRDVQMLTDFEICGASGGLEILNSKEEIQNREIGIYLTYKTSKPFEKTLTLTPKCLSVGIGTRKGVSVDAVKEAVYWVFEENNLSISAIESISSIDIKSEEAGILQFCESLDIKPNFFSSGELLKAEGDFSHSEFVRSVTGVSNVCERASVMGGGEKIIVKKTAKNGVTVAVAVINKVYKMEGENGKC